jgi:hypothetical protein
VSENEAGEWLKLLQGGGNAAIIVLAIVAINVAKAFLAELRALRRGQEAIKLAIVAGNPRAEEVLRRHADVEAQGPSA